MRKIALFIVTVFVLGFLYYFRVPIVELFRELTKPAIPEPVKFEEALSETAKSPADVQPPEMPLEINLDVPFAPQAPFANWNLPYQEACEEASAILVHKFYAGEKLTPAIMDQEILKLVEWQKKRFGYYEHTTAEEVGIIMSEYFGHKNVEVRYDINIEDIKKEISKGYPVIIPAAGRLLYNPYFRQPGPIYHMLVVKGFLKDGRLITNDVGTKRGHNFIYDPDVFLNAIHDWNAGDMEKGRKAMIVVKNDATSESEKKE